MVAADARTAVTFSLSPGQERRVDVAGHRRDCVVVHWKKVVQARRDCLVQAHGDRNDGVALPGKPALERRRRRNALRDRREHSVLLQRLPDDEKRASVAQRHSLHSNARRQIPRERVDRAGEGRLLGLYSGSNDRDLQRCEAIEKELDWR